MAVTGIGQTSARARLATPNHTAKSLRRLKARAESLLRNGINEQTFGSAQQLHYPKIYGQFSSYDLLVGNGLRSNGGCDVRKPFILE
jgi:hypothetical protein